LGADEAFLTATLFGPENNPLILLKYFLIKLSIPWIVISFVTGLVLSFDFDAINVIPFLNCLTQQILYRRVILCENIAGLISCIE